MSFQHLCFGYRVARLKSQKTNSYNKKQVVIIMEKIIETVSLLNDEDKKKILELANILLKQNKYNELRKEIEARRSEVRKGEVLSHEEIWRDKGV